MSLGPHVGNPGLNERVKSRAKHLEMWYFAVMSERYELLQSTLKTVIQTEEMFHLELKCFPKNVHIIFAKPRYMHAKRAANLAVLKLKYVQIIIIGSGRHLQRGAKVTEQKQKDVNEKGVATGYSSCPGATLKRGAKLTVKNKNKNIENCET